MKKLFVAVMLTVLFVNMFTCAEESVPALAPIDMYETEQQRESKDDAIEEITEAEEQPSNRDMTDDEMIPESPTDDETLQEASLVSEESNEVQITDDYEHPETADSEDVPEIIEPKSSTCFELGTYDESAELGLSEYVMMSTKPIVLQSNPSGVLTVGSKTTGGYKLTAAKKGEALVSVKASDGTKKTVRYVVGNAVSAVYLPAEETVLLDGESQSEFLHYSTAGGHCGSRYGVSVKSGDERIITASVSAEGGCIELKPKKTGTTSITLTTYNGKKAVCKVRVVANCAHANAHTAAAITDTSGNASDIDENGHVMYAWFDSVYCPDCENVIVEGRYAPLEYETHIFEHGMCSVCGYERFCPHEHTESVESAVAVDVLDRDQADHTVVVNSVMKIICTDCGKVLNTEASDGAGSTVTAVHEFIGGKCAVCGYGCLHNGGSVDTERRFEGFSEINENDHVSLYTVKDTIACQICGSTVSEKVSYERETEHHDWNKNHECGACGYINVCSHTSETKPVVSYDTKISSSDMRNCHTIVYSCTRSQICLVCNDAVSAETEIYNGDTGIERVDVHAWTDGICAYCGYGCLHGESHIDSYTERLSEPVSGGAKQHSFTERYITERLCSECKMVLQRTEGKKFTFKENHQWANGVCFTCGQENTCEHIKMTAGIEYRTDMGTVISEKDYGNIVSCDREETFVCSKCGADMGVSRIKTDVVVQPAIVDCRHTNTQTVQKTVERTYKTVDKTRHKATSDRIEEVYCIDCKTVLSETVTGSVTANKPHLMDGFSNCCSQCGYITTCKHGKTKKKAQKTDIYTSLDMDYHLRMTSTTSEVSCSTCKALLSYKTSAEENEIRTRHRFVDGICMSCNMPESSCDHDYSFGACSFCGSNENNNIKSISLGSPLTLGLGESYLLNVAYLPQSGYGELITFKSSAPKIVSVDESGLLKAKKTGTATIIASFSAEDEDDGGRVTAKLKVTVKSAAKAVVIPADLILYPGEVYTIKPKLTGSSATLSWTSTEPCIYIDNGTIQAVGSIGESSKIAVTTFNEHSSECLVSIMPEPDRITADYSELRIGYGQTVKLNAKAMAGEDAACPRLTYGSGNTKIAKVDTNGKITAQRKSGTTVVTITAANGLRLEIPITVCPAPSKVSLKPTKVTLMVGETYVVSPIIAENSAAAFTYSSSKPTIARVENRGDHAVIYAEKAGSAVITVKTYNGMKTQLTVTIKQE